MVSYYTSKTKNIREKYIRTNSQKILEKGCCISIPSLSSLYISRHSDSNSSSRVITSSQPQSQLVLPGTLTNTTSQSEPQEIQECNLKSHLNKPLERPVWSSIDRKWTSAELDRERDEFFHTRTSGRPEVWQTLKAVLEILWAGSEDADGGLETAQQILDAADIIVPHCNLSPGVYDSFGAYYPIPKHIISNPTNVTKTPTIELSDNKKSGEESNDDNNEEDTTKRREEKGKSVVKPRDVIRLRIKLSDRDASPIQISIGREESARIVALKIVEESALPPTKTIRIAYMGKILKENLSLPAQGWKDDHVVNGLVFG
ncbi:Uncharacterized protein PB2B4.07 [Golovinomyces cichoracearum]|uniref:Uncharacterized protein PB2B4.07 n=1 Tax=Golovinomyces cichoracearum TaxID=62708 RepID=A0A420J2T4_9PEZI|nr:Uncharacterized protein PB2B4.07 [Golovinomyces cichoracearum]